MPAMQPARGTQDLLPAAARRHRRVSETARETAALYGFAEIATPIFEFTEVFARPIGEHTEVVALGQRILKELGIAERVVLELNTLGDPESRAAYRQALVGYFSARKSELSEDSRRRLETNPLRILDSKDPGDVRLNAEAPAF